MGIDMLYRLKKYKLIVQHFLSLGKVRIVVWLREVIVGKVIESLDFAREFLFEYIDPKIFFDFAFEKKDKALFESLEAFFLNVKLFFSNMANQNRILKKVKRIEANLILMLNCTLLVSKKTINFE